MTPPTTTYQTSLHRQSKRCFFDAPDGKKLCILHISAFIRLTPSTDLTKPFEFELTRKGSGYDSRDGRRKNIGQGGVADELQRLLGFDTALPLFNEMLEMLEPGQQDTEDSYKPLKDNLDGTSADCVFTSEDLEILNAQIRYLDQIDDVQWFEKTVSDLDSRITKLQVEKQHLYDMLDLSPSRRQYLDERKLYIQEQMEEARDRRRLEAEQRSKAKAASNPTTKSSGPRAERIPKALQDLLRSKGIDPAILSQLHTK